MSNAHYTDINSLQDSFKENQETRHQQEELDKLTKDLKLIKDNLQRLAERKAELEDLKETLPIRLQVNEKYTKHLKEEFITLSKKLTANPLARLKPIYGIDKEGCIQVVLQKLTDCEPLGLDVPWLSQVINKKRKTTIYAGLYWTRDPNTPTETIQEEFELFDTIAQNKSEKTWKELFNSTIKTEEQKIFD